MSDYFKKIPISNHPEKAGVYHVYIGEALYAAYFTGTYFIHEGVTHWLQPCSPPDEGALAKWVFKTQDYDYYWKDDGTEYWLQLSTGKQISHSELLAIFKHQTGR